MKKRFIDYYRETVLNKGSGGGGSSVVMSDAYLPDKTFDWTVNASRTQFASIADLDAWFKSADETTPVYVAGYYSGMQEGDTILVNTRINPTGTEDYFEAYFWGVVKEFVAGSSMSVRMKAFEGYSVPSQGDKLNGATYIAQNGDFEGQTTGATLEVEVPSGGGGGHEIEDGLLDGSLSGDYVNDRIGGLTYTPFRSHTHVTGISLPNAFFQMHGYDFENCKALASINIPQCTGTGYNSFYNCKSLQELDLPRGANIATSGAPTSGTQSSSSCAFAGCTSFKSLKIGRTTIQTDVCRIFKMLFYNCSSVEELVIERTYGLYTLNGGLFASTASGDSSVPSGFKIYVPDALVESYKTASNWSYYASYIYPLSERPTA